MKPLALPRLEDYLAHWATVSPDRQATVGASGTASWREIEQSVDRWTIALVEAGVEPGDHLAIRTEPDPIYVEMLLAATRIGAVLIALNPRASQDEANRIVTESRPRLILDCTRFPIQPPQPSTTVIARDELDDFAHVSDTEAAFRTQTAPDPRRPCAIVYTSGSTGHPKGALLPERSLIWAARTQASHWWDGAPAKLLCNLPMSQVAGICDVCVFGLVIGATIVFQERFDPTSALQLIETHGVTHWGAVPAMPALCIDSDKWSSCDLSSMRLLYWMGGKMSAPVAKEWLARVPMAATAYGMTETVGSITFTDPTADVDLLCNTIGAPDPGIEVRLDLSGGDDSGGIGEIVARSDYFIPGYFDMPTQSGLYDANGWLHTGDWATRRPDGNYVLVGRRDDQYKSGGYTIHPAEIENVLQQHPEVRSVAVVPVADRIFGQVSCAFVVCRTSISEEELRTFVKSRLANYKVPRRVLIVPELPLLASGKVDRAGLRRLVRVD